MIFGPGLGLGQKPQDRQLPLPSASAHADTGIFSSLTGLRLNVSAAYKRPIHFFYRQNVFEKFELRFFGHIHSFTHLFILLSQKIF